MRNLFLYGPPGSGKSTLGKLLAERLDLPFLDLDSAIQNDAGMSVRKIFAEEGEKGFRARERRALETVSKRTRSVIALGGGSLLDPACRALAESSGTVVCLDCPLDVLRARIGLTPGTRPLVTDVDADSALGHLMASRAEHYASFRRRLDTAGRSPDDLCAAAETLFGAYRITSGDVPSTVCVGVNLLTGIGDWAHANGMGRRAVVVADSNTDSIYGDRVAESLRAAGIEVARAVIPAGEEHKTLETVQSIWRAFLRAGLGRDDFAVAVGGGVTGDLTGFAAATWMRGMKWINVPTTLLSMVDASTGGKTGCDLSEAKNLVGAFHSPSLVVADAETLRTLPAREWRCGLAEAIKHSIISGVEPAAGLSLFQGLKDVPDDAAFSSFDDYAGLADFVSHTLSVKVRFVQEDPREKNVRGKLNLGHTVGHAVEILSNFKIQHGEAVAIGTVEEARLAVRLGHAAVDWPDRVAVLFAQVGLPTELPGGLSFETLVPVMKRDKKKKNGVIRFALPYDFGNVSLTPVDL